MNTMALRQVLVGLLFLLLIKNVYKGLQQLFNADYEEDYLEYLSDRVARENFTYYSFHNEGAFRLKLLSTYGDADIYVSSTRKPSYQPFSYEICSTTCGVDIVELTESIPRPAFIGIYGSGHTDFANYTLFIQLDTSSMQEYSKEFGLRHKLSMVLRYTTMWRIFEILESVIFVL